MPKRAAQSARELRRQILAEAVLLYICGPEEPREGWRGTWDDVARELGIGVRTLRKYKAEVGLYEEAFSLALGEKRQRLAAIAFRRLASSAEAEPGGPGVAAANSLLDRIGYPALHRTETKAEVSYEFEDLDPDEAAEIVREALAELREGDTPGPGE